MPDDLESQLQAFGATLESQTGEPIANGSPMMSSSAARPSRRWWSIAGAAACPCAIVIGLVVVTGRDADAPAARPPSPDASVFGSGDSSGLGAFEPLSGVGAVIEGTVVGFRGPMAVAVESGGVDYPGRSEDADEWTTPFGLPVIVLSDVRLVASVGGSGRADEATGRVERALQSGEGIEVLAPVGVYREGDRYELWLSPEQDIGLMSYLAFDESGKTIDGLSVSGADEAFRRLTEHTGEGRVATLAAMARELNVASDDGPRGPLMEFVYGPEEVSSEENSSEFYDGTTEDGATREGHVQIDVRVFGADPSNVYGLRGDRVLGWFSTDDEGRGALSGELPLGETVHLVVEASPGGVIDDVPGVPPLVVDTEMEEYRAVIDLDDDLPAWETELSLAAMNNRMRSELGLPPEGVHDDPLGLERDGWALVQRTTHPFDYDPDVFSVPCPQAEAIEAFNGTSQVIDMLEHPTLPDVDVLVLDVGSVDAGSRLADAFLGSGDCVGRAAEAEVAETALSSIRATWFRVGSELAIATIVGEQGRSVVLGLEGQGIDDDLIGDLAHRADQFLRGEPITGAGSGRTVSETSRLGEAQVEPVGGQVKLWVSNQSFEDDTVAITIEIDGVEIVADTFEVGGQHNWFSFMIDGLEPGEHTLTATSDTGAAFEGTFTPPPGEPRWMVVDYWYYPDDAEGRHFTFDESDEPIYFA
jgi:hypothetical protein